MQQCNSDKKINKQMKALQNNTSNDYLFLPYICYNLLIK